MSNWSLRVFLRLVILIGLTSSRSANQRQTKPIWLHSTCDFPRSAPAESIFSFQMTVESNYVIAIVIGLKDSRQFSNQWESKPKPIAPCTRDFSRSSSELQVIARNCDWFIALPAPLVIGRSNCFGFGFSTVIWKPLYDWLNLLNGFLLVS